MRSGPRTPLSVPPSVRKPPRFYADWAFWILVGPSLTAAVLVLVTR